MVQATVGLIYCRVCGHADGQKGGQKSQLGESRNDPGDFVGDLVGAAFADR